MLGYDGCARALYENRNKENRYTINVPGTSRYVSATCKLIQKSPVTVFSHDNNKPTFVHGYEGKGSYRKVLKYEENLADIILVIKQAITCRQFVRTECRHSVITDYAWLQDRSGSRLSYWGGGPQNGAGCACGVTGTCKVSSQKCNCDNNNFPPTVDEGYITKKDALPLTAIALGDTGHSGESMNYTIGDVECFFPSAAKPGKFCKLFTGKTKVNQNVHTRAITWKKFSLSLRGKRGLKRYLFLL